MAGVRIVGGRLPFGSLQAEVDQAALATAREASALAVSRVKDVLLSGEDSRGFVGRKDLGLAHNAVGSTAPAIVAPGLIRARTGIGPPRDEIAAVLEDGRRPGARMPPPDSLKPWVKRKLRNQIAAAMRGARVTTKAGAAFKALVERAAKRGKTLGKGASAKVSGVSKEAIDKAADAVAFVVARSIGRKGTPGLHAFQHAARAIQPKLRGIFERNLRRAASGRAPGSFGFDSGGAL